MAKTEPEPVRHDTLVRTNEKLSAWLDELATELGQTRPEVYRTLLREEMRRRKKRGDK